MNLADLASRLPLLLAAVAALVAGIAVGLARLGVDLPAAVPYVADHGILMVAAFFGTVIGLERAVALGRPWALLAPVGAAVGGLALLARLPTAWVTAFFVAGATGFLLVSIVIMRRHLVLHAVVLAIAAAALLCGHVLWLAGAGPETALPCWLAFLALTIAGERLELTRVLPPAPGARTTFRFILGGVLGSAALASSPWVAGRSLFGLALAALALWLLRFDVARRTVRDRGLTRYIAVCLLTGYGWLALAGLLGAGGGFAVGDPWRDTALHAFTLGFVISMVFGHAPVIVPAITGARVAWTGLFYLPFGVLHGSLAVRAAGVLLGDVTLVRSGALGNALAIALFAATLVSALLRGRFHTGRR